MSTTIHHAIVVTQWVEEYDTETTDLRDLAIRLFGPRMVSSLCRAQANGYVTFVIGPDGHNEGWPNSNANDSRRRDFLIEATYNAVEFEYGETSPSVSSFHNRDEILVALDRIAELGVEDEHILAIRKALDLRVPKVLKP